MIKGLEGDIRNARDKDKIPAAAGRSWRRPRPSCPTLEHERDKHTQYYEVEMDRKQAHLTHDGIAEAQRIAGIGSFYVGENMDVPHLLEQALRAHVVYQRDRDYVVMPTREPADRAAWSRASSSSTSTPAARWSGGSGPTACTRRSRPRKACRSSQETQTVATITIQNFFKMYKRLAGMTGTADTEAQEFHDIYKLDVVAIPTNSPVIRRDFDDLDVPRRQGQVGGDRRRDQGTSTTSAARSSSAPPASRRARCSRQMLTRKHGIKHEVLNAKQHEREAHIVENAGQLGAVMIATNMAGRGTDIKLGSDHPRGSCSTTGCAAASAARGSPSRPPTSSSARTSTARSRPRSSDIPKREVEEMPFAELELELLRHWATQHTWVEPKQDRVDGRR